MRILVTGGAGFIGSHLAKRLLEAGHKVIVVDDLSTGSRDNVPEGAELLVLDLSRPESLSRLPDDVAAVCHLAAQSAGAVSAEQPYYDLMANAGSTLLLSRWCLERGIGRFVYASSMAVYGDEVESPVGEDARCVPKSYYGASKLAAEHVLRLAAPEGLNVTVFRIFTAYGPGQNLRNLKQGMVSIYLAYLLRGVAVPVTGSLDRFRDLIYVDDVVEAWRRAVETRATPRLVYNLGTGRGTTVRELLQALARACDLPADHPVEELPGSPSDQFGLFADVSAVSFDLDVAPPTRLEDGLQRMVSWATAGSGTPSA